MRAATTTAWLATGVLAVFAFAADAKADFHGFRNNSATRSEIRGDRREILNDRGELRRDLGELSRDRADLRRDYRTGASSGDIAAKRAEIRQDVNEIRGDRRELSADYRGLRRDSNQFGWGRPSYSDRYDSGRSWNPWFRR